MTGDGNGGRDARLFEFLEGEVEADRSRESGPVDAPPPIPPRLRLLHEIRDLSLRLRADAEIVGDSIGREEADALAARQLSQRDEYSIAAFQEILDDFQRLAGTDDDE